MIIARTERLLLRPFAAPDLTALRPILGDAEVMRFGPGAQPPASIQTWLHDCLAAYDRFGYGPWAVVELRQHRLIGYCGLFYFPDINRQPETEIGYRLARTAWGQGYATEAALAVREYAFTTLGLPRLVALIDPQNSASIRVAAKLGMQHEQDVLFEGYTHPDRVYAVAHPDRT